MPSRPGGGNRCLAPNPQRSKRGTFLRSQRTLGFHRRDPAESGAPGMRGCVCGAGEWRGVTAALVHDQYAASSVRMDVHGGFRYVEKGARGKLGWRSANNPFGWLRVVARSRRKWQPELLFGCNADRVFRPLERAVSTINLGTPEDIEMADEPIGYLDYHGAVATKRNGRRWRQHNDDSHMQDSEWGDWWFYVRQNSISILRLAACGSIGTKSLSVLA